MRIQNGLQDENLRKLIKMRWVATGLLVAMTVIFFVFRSFREQNLLISSVVAFSEASMIGALADWFAVTALFRHPMGMKWIPHTAIIRNSKERIGKSLSDFVVENFFTEEVIKGRLERMDIVGRLSGMLEKNARFIADFIAGRLPGWIQTAWSEKGMEGFAQESLDKGLRSIKLYPLAGSIMEMLYEAGLHRPMAKGLLLKLYETMEKDKDATMDFLENINKALTLPFIGDLVYRNLLKTVQKQLHDLDSVEPSSINRFLDDTLPEFIVMLETSEELVAKGEELKDGLLRSKDYRSLSAKILLDGKNALVAWTQASGNEISDSISSFARDQLAELCRNPEEKAELEAMIHNIILQLVANYKQDIARLIDDTVKNWETDEMVDKLEVQVGGDLQFIRINGTIVGGLAGLLIHLVTRLL